MEPGFNASRKADREKIAAGFVAVAEKFGAAITRRDTDPNVGYCGAGIDMTFSLNGVGAMIDIDNLHGGDNALIHWYNTEYPVRKFESGFTVAVGQIPIYAPHHKATSSGTWDLLAARLQAGLRKARDGKAFIPLTENAEA